MKCTHAVWFATIPLLVACSDNTPTAPDVGTLASFAPAASQGANHELRGV